MATLQLDQKKSQHFRPLPDTLELKASDVHGTGVFATKDLPAGTDLGITHVFSDDPNILTLYPDGWVRNCLGNMYNQDKRKPSCEIIEQGGDKGWKRLVTIRDIKAGEEITAIYTLYDPEA